MRNTIFISYSHKDKEWLDRFENALKVGVLREAYETWSDEKIGTGENWNEKIESTISAAKFALLLVTPDFLRSEYINHNELKTIIDRHAKNGLTLFWIPIKCVPEHDLRLVGLDQIQSPWAADRPLAELPAEECEKAIDMICGRLIMRLGIPANTSTETIQDLEVDLAAALGASVVLSKQIQFGQFSIVYKAMRRNKTVAIKIILPSMRRGWVANDFITRADHFQDIESPFIRVYDTIRKDRVNCVIMEYIDFPTLKNVIDHSESGALQPLEAADVLYQVALAADNLHHKAAGQQSPLFVGPLRPSHVYRNHDGSIKISPLHISHATLASADARPMPMLTEDELTYLSPERYAGERSQFATDQYYIALLGLELLTGTPPVTVNCYADLDKKKAFFDDPMAAFEKHRKASPALLFVLRKMLERRPEDRWKSMSYARSALWQVVHGSVPDVVRERAQKTYFNILEGGDFYHNFYSTFFRICQGAREIFDARNTNLEVQRKKLHKAVGVLLNFRRGDKPNPMSQYAEDHQEYRLRPEYFDAFREAFLTELARLKPMVDAYDVDAWRAVLDAGIPYMKEWAVPPLTPTPPD
jgi:serine/threonine protein kinase